MKKNHQHKWKKIMLTSAPFAKGSYMWWCKKCNARVLTEECPAEKTSEEKPQVTEEWIEEKAREAWSLWWYKASGKYVADFTGTIRFDFQGVKNLIRSLVEEIRGK